MTLLGFGASNATVYQTINGLDANDTGVLEFDEFLRLMANRINDNDSRANINKIFEMYDGEGAGIFQI